MAFKIESVKNDYTEESGSAHGVGGALALAAAIVVFWPIVLLWKLARLHLGNLLLTPAYAFAAYQAYVHEIYLTVGAGAVVLLFIIFIAKLWNTN
jgi:hypothetical protein